MNPNNENFNDFNNNQELYPEENKIFQDNIFLPVQVEKYLSVINNNIIFHKIYRIILIGEI